MNWAGRLVQKELENDYVVLSLGCGIMAEILDTLKSYPKDIIKCKNIIGLDIFKPYLDLLNERGIKTVNWDLRIFPYPFKDKEIDVILLMDVLEHIDKDYHKMILDECERIARKKIIVLTPIKYFDNKKAVKNTYIGYDF